VSNEIDREAVVSVTELPNESVADWLEDFVRGECMFRSDEKPAMFSEIARRLRSTPDEGRCERDARIADLERRLKEAERDAGRYRWLREHGTSVTLPRVYDEKYEAVMWIALDKAIDSAMGKETG
jgi:hypothetical protein